MMPPLTTFRLSLQSVKLRDLNAIKEIVSHPLFIKASIGCQMPQSDTQLLHWLCSQQKQYLAQKGYCYMLRYINEETILGMVNLQATGQQTELNYWLHPHYWRQGLMTEAVSIVISKWLEQHKDSHITARCHLDNLASQALLLRVGMQLHETEPEKKILSYRWINNR